MGSDAGRVRVELKFRIIGYVLMPEHFPALIGPTAEANRSRIVQKLEDRTALFILRNLRENLGHPCLVRRLQPRRALPRLGELRQDNQSLAAEGRRAGARFQVPQ